MSKLVDMALAQRKKPTNFDLNALEEFRSSMTMLITLIPIVKDQNDYIYSSYYGQVVTDI